MCTAGWSGTSPRAGSGGWPEPLSPEEFPTLAPLAGYLANPDLDTRFELGLRILRGHSRHLFKATAFIGD